MPAYLNETTMRIFRARQAAVGFISEVKAFSVFSLNHYERKEILMKKLKMNDLTPELLKEVTKLSTPQEIIAFFQTKDYEVSEKGAQKILDYLKEQKCELEDDELDKISGGCSDDSDSNCTWS